MGPELNRNIFRAYDIRGVAEPSSNGHLPDLNDGAVDAIGRGFAELLRHQATGSLVIGGDNRRSTERIRGVLTKALLNAGWSVIDIGLSTSPLLYYCVAAWGAAGGVNVTGSHNPPHHNGLKLIGPGAIPISSDEIQQIYRLATTNGFEGAAVSGTLLRRDPRDEYVTFLRDYVERKNGLVQPPFPVVVDGANGVASLVAPDLLRSVGCEVTELYCDLDSDFPNRGLDPTDARNLTALQSEVVTRGAKLGFAFDGDGDRVAIVDESGVMIESEYVLILLARDLLSRVPGATVLYDVRCSSNVPRDIAEHGGVPYMFKSGHSLIKREMRDKRILLGGEGSGHMFFGEEYWGVESGILAAAKVASILSQSETPLAEHFGNLPRMSGSPEFRIEISDDEKFDIAKRVGVLLKENGPTSEVDGVRVDFNGGWALVRASNTNPEIIVRAEAEDRSSLRAILHSVLEAFPSSVSADALHELRAFVGGSPT